jgi:hypothetical protein
LVSNPLRGFLLGYSRRVDFVFAWDKGRGFFTSRRSYSIFVSAKSLTLLDETLLEKQLAVILEAVTQHASSGASLSRALPLAHYQWGTWWCSSPLLCVTKVW